jgi:hypothetical protein
VGHRATPLPTPPVDTGAIIEGPSTPQQREEGSRGVARKAVAEARGRQSRRSNESSHGVARKAVTASRGRQSRRRESRRREEGSGGGVDAREIGGVKIYSKTAYLAMAAGQRAGERVWLRQRNDGGGCGVL